MSDRIIDQFELRANPTLIGELRGAPSGEFIERRYAPLRKIETRDGDSELRVGGNAAVFDSMSENLGGFREIIKHGAFRKVLDAQPDVRFLVNHDPNLVFARTTAGNLTLREVGNGLEYVADMVPTTDARNFYLLMEAGVITQSSFAFRLAPGGDDWTEDPETGGLIRTISEFSALLDVSAVTYPAYQAASVGARDADVSPSVTEQPSGAVAEEPGTVAVTDVQRAHAEEDEALVGCLSVAEARARLRQRELRLKRAA